MKYLISSCLFIVIGFFASCTNSEIKTNLVEEPVGNSGFAPNTSGEKINVQYCAARNASIIEKVDSTFRNEVLAICPGVYEKDEALRLIKNEDYGRLGQYQLYSTFSKTLNKVDAQNEQKLIKLWIRFMEADSETISVSIEPESYEMNYGNFDPIGGPYKDSVIARTKPSYQYLWQIMRLNNEEDDFHVELKDFAAKHNLQGFVEKYEELRFEFEHNLPEPTNENTNLEKWIDLHAKMLNQYHSLKSEAFENDPMLQNDHFKELSLY